MVLGPKGLRLNRALMEDPIPCFGFPISPRDGGREVGGGEMVVMVRVCFKKEGGVNERWRERWGRVT